MIPVIDMHCDTISLIYNESLKQNAISLYENTNHLDIRGMKQSGYLCQNFALFTYLGFWNQPQEHDIRKACASPYEYACALSDVFDQQMAQHAAFIRPVRTADDILANQKLGLLSALKTIEEGAVYEGRTDRLKEFYEKGVRMTTLTWNYENELGYPNRIDPVTGKVSPDDLHGLKPAGKEIVQACEELGMLVDISHLNDAGIFDVFDILGNHMPVIASHSNARAITNHPRNLTDEMLKKLAESGGVTGINFCSAFLNDREDNFSSFEDMLRHIRHIEKVAGIDSIGLGSDFDGISNQVEMESCLGMQKLADYLEKHGYSHTAIEKIFYKNVLRVYQEVFSCSKKFH